MTLTVGSQLGPYEIVAPLGAGGMGEVFRARDSKLGRDVAIKVLPAALATDREHLARFQREAEALAALNHPHIAMIHGIEEHPSADRGQAGVPAIVMELVEGETLAERIRKAPTGIGLDESLHIARQIADALEAAHERGIVHRDLKPANVRITPDGTVKVLDFGLAKSVAAIVSASGLTQSPTLPVASIDGAILGTAAYMSPEQASGRAVDRRADIWAFGVVLFEMLAGRPLFRGDSTAEILAEVLKSEPAWDALPTTTPAEVRQLLTRCLERKPRSRLRDIGDARILIEEWLAKPETTRFAPAAPADAHRRARWPTAVAAASLMIAALAVGAAIWRRPSLPLASSRTWALDLGDYHRGYDFFDGPVVSPDGRMIAFDGASRGPLRIRDVDALDARTLAGTDGADMPFWSPDSASVGYLMEQPDASLAIWKVPTRGGAPVRVCDAPPGIVWGAAWLDDHQIVFNVLSGPAAGELFSVPDGGGRPVQLTTTRQKEKNETPQFPVRLPNGRWLYEASAGVLVLREPNGIERRIALDDEGMGAMAFSNGYLLHTNRQRQGIWATRFDPDRAAVQGKPTVVVPDGRFPSVSADGTLVYKTVAAGSQQLAWVDRTGAIGESIGQPQETLTDVSLAPDGSRVAVVSTEKDIENLWTYDVARGVRSRVDIGRPSSITMQTITQPVWSPSGERLAVSSYWNIITQRPDTTAPPQMVAGGPIVQMEPSWSPNGRFVLFSVYAGNADIFYKATEAGSAEQKFLATPANEHDPQFAPDGRHVAYASDETGREEVYLRDFPSADNKVQVSVNGGNRPRWSPRGAELFFVANDALMAATVQQADAKPRVGVPQPLFTTAKIGAESLDYAPAADGKRFVVVRTIARRARRAVVVENWLSRLRAAP